MSRVVDFTFNNMGRIGQDPYNYTQDTIMNNEQASYVLTNLNGDYNKAMSVVSNFPTMNVKASNQYGPNGSVIDQNTKLLKSSLTNTNVKINLQERSYLTIPFLGRGNVDVGMENNLKFGDTFKEKKSAVLLTEKCQNNIKDYPFHKKLKSSLGDSNKRLEESAVKGWVRGGLPSREIYKNKELQCN